MLRIARICGVSIAFCTMQGAHFVVDFNKRIPIDRLQYIVHTNIIEYFKVSGHFFFDFPFFTSTIKFNNVRFSISFYTDITVYSKMFIVKLAFWKYLLAA